MKIYYSADLHLGHDNIIKYVGRPFKDGNGMNKSLILNWNQRVKEDDIIYHIGDFCFRGGREGGKTKSQIWESKLNGKIIHILGNHDYQNHIKGLDVGVMQHGGKTLMLKHIPPMHPAEIPDFVDIVLCGHVHNVWKHSFVGDIPLINVGIDVWDYKPININEILKYHQDIMTKEK